MNNNIGIHHHFNLSKGIKRGLSYAKYITFQNIPFFQLYDLRSLNNIRNFVDALRTEMPHKYQDIYSKFKPPEHKEHNHYREEVIKLTYCEYNKQVFFLRCYRLRQNDFIKVEITFFSESNGGGKYLHLDKTINSAERVFQFLDQGGVPFNLLLHKDEYFFPSDFIEHVRVYEQELLFLRSQNNSNVKKTLKRKLLEQLLQFQKFSKKIAQQRLESIKLDIELSKTLEHKLL